MAIRASSNGWSFSKLDFQPRVKTLRQAARVTIEPPILPYFEPRSAIVRRPTYQSNGLTLLSIPLEVRDHIWEIVHEDIRQSAEKQAWHARPATAYDSLQLVCRQIYYEILHYWRRSIITRHRLNHFLDQPFSITKLQQFQSLTVEVPYNMPADFFFDMNAMLRYVAPFLQHLNIFFVGQDAYGTLTLIHGCANKDTDSHLQKLPCDGQGFKERHVFINALAWLTRLRSLSIHNANLPLLQSHIIRNKPYLSKLYIESDPRSSVHVPWKAKNCGEGLMVPCTENFPPVKELCISANATLISVQVVSKLDWTLEKLTWICPDASRQTGSLPQDYLRDTDIILSNLHSNGEELRTLRICIEFAIYESIYAYGQAIGSFKAHLPYLRIRNLELHLWSKSPWLGIEIMESLPKSLERLYVSDRLIDTDKLLYEVDKRYFCDPRDKEGFCFTEDPELLTVIRSRTELARTDYLPLKNGNLTFINHQRTTTDDKVVKIVETCDKLVEVDDLIEDDMTETEVDIDDAFSVCIDPKGLTGDLEPDPITTDELCRLALLKLNGRLLDRARNRHLAGFEPGKPIPNYSKLTADSGTTAPDQKSLSTAHIAIIAAVAKLKPPSKGEVRTNATFLQMSDLKDDHDYFGMEKGAEEVFSREQVTRIDDVEPRTYPIEMLVGEKEHWMCELD